MSQAFIAVSPNPGNALLNSTEGDLSVYCTSNSQRIHFGSSNSNAVLTISANAVGVNNMTPAYPLDVSGTAKFTTLITKSPMCAVYSLASNWTTNTGYLDVSNVFPMPPPKILWSNVSAAYGNLTGYTDPMNSNGYIVIPTKGIYSISFGGQAGANITWNSYHLVCKNAYGVSSNNTGGITNPIKVLSAGDTTANSMGVSYTGPFLSNDMIALSFRIGGQPLYALNTIGGVYTTPTLSVSLISLLP
jgi:hypothetical protein